MSNSRPALNLGSALLAILVIAGLGIYLPLHLLYVVEREPSSGEPVQQTESQNSPTIGPAQADVPEWATADPPDSDYADKYPSKTTFTDPVRETATVARSSPPSGPAAAFDPEQTSWEAPFEVAYWESTGWQFDSRSMLSSGDESAAMFRRAYVRFMFECRIEPQVKSAEPLRVRLQGPSPNAVMTLAIDGTRLEVTDDSRSPPVILKEANIVSAAAGESAHLKLAATGNRLIVTWNGTASLTCNQIPGQSGRPVRFGFAASRTAWRIRDLRIEGE